MKRVSEVGDHFNLTKAKVSFHGSPWNVGDGSCLLTKASLQLLGRTHEIATSPRPVAVILDTFGLETESYVIMLHRFNIQLL